VPLHADVRAGGDSGRPALADEDAPAPVRGALRDTASELARQVSIRVLAAPRPPLVQIQGLS